MARKRNVYALRQILASDVNDQNEFRIADFKNIIKDVIGASSGVVSGLSGSYSGQVVAITAGSITDGETIFELLEDGELTIPATDGTYKVYAKQNITSDLPISGFKLINIETKAETYDTVNSRTYDSILLGYTTGTIPIDSELIGNVVVSGGVITSYADARNFITIGNLTAYSLQNFAVNNNSTLDKADYFNSIIGDLTNNNIINATALNTNAVTLFKINNGTNSGSNAFEVTSTGNVSYKSINNSNATGFYSLGNSQTGTIGFKADSNAINFSSTLLANTVGLKVIGVNSDDIGIEIVNVEKGIFINNPSQSTGSFSSSNVLIEGGADYVTDENDPLNYTSYFANNVYSNINETGVGFVSNWKTSADSSQKFTGFMALNNASNVGGIGFIALSDDGGGTLNSSNQFDIGFASYFNKANFKSIQGNDSFGFSTELTEDGDGGDYLSTAGFNSIIKNSSTGLIIRNESSGTESFGIIGYSDNTTKFFKKFMEINNYETGIDLIGNTTNSVLGINISNSTNGIKVVGNSSASGYGLQIDNVLRAIDIGNASVNSVKQGLIVGNTDEPIKIIATNVSDYASPFSAIQLDLSKRQYGIEIKNSRGSAIKFDNAYVSGDGLQTDILFSNHASSPVIHMVCLNPPSVTPYTGHLPAGAALQFYNNSGLYELKFWNGTAWKTVDVS